MTATGPAEIPALVCASCGWKRLPDDLDPWRVADVSVCANCLGTTFEAGAFPGDGVVRAFTWYREEISEHLHPIPYNIAFIEVAPGVLLFAGVDETSSEELRVDLAIEAYLRESGEGKTVLRFRPASAATG